MHVQARNVEPCQLSGPLSRVGAPLGDALGTTCDSSQLSHGAGQAWAGYNTLSVMHFCAPQQPHLDKRVFFSDAVLRFERQITAVEDSGGRGDNKQEESALDCYIDDNGFLSPCVGGPCHASSTVAAKLVDMAAAYGGCSVFDLCKMVNALQLGVQRPQLFRRLKFLPAGPRQL